VITLIHKFKYHHYDHLAVTLAEFLYDKFNRFDLKADLISCVPSHPAKVKERGYNPAKLLAKNLANHFNIIFIDDIIYENDYRLSQTSINRNKRSQNTDNAFTAIGDHEGKTVILVDDVFTTGATMNNCAKALKDKGIKNIIAITVARAYENNT
jgi:competence protein ComFC